MPKHSKGTISDVKLTLIDEPDGIVRMDIDAGYIAELAESISEEGLLQDILLAVKGDRFEIVFGHMRYLAHKKLGLSKIRARIKTMTRDQVAIARATENINRKDLTPLEEAATYRDLIERYGLSLEKVAKRMGKSAGTVKRRMDILRMPPQLQEAVHQKRLSISVAEELWPISDLTQLDYYLTFALDGGCTRDIARQWCKEWKDSLRRKDSAVEGGGEPPPVYQPRPTFLPCDLCQGPVELGKDRVFRACPECAKLITDAVKGV